MLMQPVLAVYKKILPQQRICQRARACGEETGVPKASQATADWERAHWILGVDLQSRLDSSFKKHGCVRKKKKKERKSPFFSLSLSRCRGGVAGGGGWDCRGEVPTGRCVVQEETKPSRWKQGWVSVACFTMVHYHRRPMVNQAQKGMAHRFHLMTAFGHR